MKSFTKRFATFFALIVFASISVSAQNNASVWSVDFVKTKDGQRENYLKFVENKWAKARSFMKNKKIVSSFQVLSTPTAKDWDVLLITEYVDQNGYAKREEVFNEYRKNAAGENSAAANKLTAREMSEIKLNQTFHRPITPEIGEIMLAAQIVNPEEAAVRIPLQNYLKGHATGDPEFMKKAFHTEGKLIFISEGKYTTRTFEEYIAGMSGKPAADEPLRKRYIESVDVAGNAAFGKIILDYPSVKFVDYMSLLKIGDEWKIVNKSFYAEPKPQK